VRSVKERKEWIATEAEARRRQELRQKEKLREEIRKQDDVRRERKRLAQEMAAAQHRSEQETRLTAEQAKISEQEARLMDLERREMQLMQSLQSYNGEQRDAIDQLEAFLPRRSSGRPDRAQAPLAIMGPQQSRHSDGDGDAPSRPDRPRT
jgi:vacuolar-type H+-ATPase subunit I/STV1